MSTVPIAVIGPIVDKSARTHGGTTFARACIQEAPREVDARDEGAMFCFTLPRGWNRLASSKGRHICRHARALRLESLEPRLSLSGDAVAAPFAVAAVQPLPANNPALATPLPQAAVAASLPQGPSGDSLAAVMVMSQATQAAAVQQSGFNPLGQFPFDPFSAAVTQDSFTDVEPRVVHISEEEALLVEPQVTPGTHEQAVSPADAETSLLTLLFANEQLPERGSALRND